VRPGHGHNVRIAWGGARTHLLRRVRIAHAHDAPFPVSSQRSTCHSQGFEVHCAQIPQRGEATSNGGRSNRPAKSCKPGEAGLGPGADALKRALRTWRAQRQQEGL